MSFSAHADAKGIMQLIDHVKPQNVMFVHGENSKMNMLKGKVEKVGVYYLELVELTPFSAI